MARQPTPLPLTPARNTRDLDLPTNVQGRLLCSRGGEHGIGSRPLSSCITTKIPWYHQFQKAQQVGISDAMLVDIVNQYFIRKAM